MRENMDQKSWILAGEIHGSMAIKSWAYGRIKLLSTCIFFSSGRRDEAEVGERQKEKKEKKNTRVVRWRRLVEECENESKYWVRLKRLLLTPDPGLGPTIYLDAFFSVLFFHDLVSGSPGKKTGKKGEGWILQLPLSPVVTELCFSSASFHSLSFLHIYSQQLTNGSEPLSPKKNQKKNGNGSSSWKGILWMLYWDGAGEDHDDNLV